MEKRYTNTCEHCRHWDVKDMAEQEGFGDCKKVIYREGKSGADLIVMGVQAYVMDSESCHAWLLTTSGFGCSLFEKLGRQ